MSIEDLLPHRGQMLLIDELLDWEESQARARLRLGEDHPFADASGRVPTTVGLEMMAQTVAAWAGARGRRDGLAPRVGYLLACRSYQCSQPRFDAGAELTVTMYLEMRQDNGFGAYRGEIHQGERCLAQGRLSVMEQAPEALSGENE